MTVAVLFYSGCVKRYKIISLSYPVVSWSEQCPFSMWANVGDGRKTNGTWSAKRLILSATQESKRFFFPPLQCDGTM